MDWAIFLGVTLLASVLVALVARDIAARMARAGGEPEFTAILLAIVISAVVLLGASRLAVAVDWLYARAGVDAATAIGGQFRVAAFAASFVPIAAYVLTFLGTFRRVKGTS
ncbi:hypothetical protein [Sinisalibacter aestuarii]|uniref:Uncharacterized protein n=1 Tax=Sinisalibacter aestuarii TaxID=2949426 RepID=A0ABQ5LUA4_9RHOB|nr:hypothetical protein [Sinisalibacter aestuarii]GKY88203.1 hypothetical protein STA1M1_20720 [Sinisalibacter aestuarii]